MKWGIFLRGLSTIGLNEIIYAKQLTKYLRRILKNISYWDFPGAPVVGTSPSIAGGMGLIPGREARIPHDSWPKDQNRNQALL